MAFGVSRRPNKKDKNVRIGKQPITIPNGIRSKIRWFVLSFKKENLKRL